MLLAALLVACAATLDRRVEQVVLEALPRLVGPADRYEAIARGSSPAGDWIDELRATGWRVRRDGAPVLDRVELVLAGVAIDRVARRVSAVERADVTVRIAPGDLAEHLRPQEWIEDPVVRFEAPADVIVSGRLRVPGLPFLATPTGEFRGELVPRGAQLAMRVRALSIGDRQAPGVVRAVLEQAINPLFDVAEYAVPARVDRAAVEGDRLVLQASGSRTSPRR